MEAFATYLIKSSVWLTGFALVYALFLRNERFFTLNRIYLVSGILFSMIFPLFTWHYTVLIPIVPSVEISEPQVQGIIIPEESFNPQNLLLLAYLAGILYLSYRILRQTLPVFRIIRKSETQLYSSAKLIRTDAYPASFSFFSFVFVNPSIDEIETNEIVNHELEHIRQQHWIDLLLFEILRTMQWFNPVSWLYGHLIRQNHEYLADEQALQRSSNPAIYRAALLNQMFGGPVISLANSFNYSLNKKRFNMMKQTISSPIRKLKLLVVLPLIAGVFYAFATPEYKFIGGVENQGSQKSLYTITKDKIDIPFTTQLQKSDLNAVKTELAKLGITIDYTSMDFSIDGGLKQITATVKQSDGGSVSFTSGELTTTNYPTFKTYSDGSFGVYSQKAVTGKVISEDGKPLKGATVSISGKTTGTVTDANGNFKLILTDNSPILISYVGYNTLKVNPDLEKPMTVKMETNSFGIDKVTVVGYLDATQPPPTYNPKNPPLYVLDGKIIDKDEMDKINPENIESISVLKDQSATALYGEKGKNGVVDIKLKPTAPPPSPTLIPIETSKNIKEVYTVVEQMPEFPGGADALRWYLAQSVKYPVEPQAKGIQGTVYVKFVVTKTGKVTNAKAVRGVDQSLDKEAIRVVESLPDWKPGKQLGTDVDVSYTIPIEFVLQPAATNNVKTTTTQKTVNDVFTVVEEMPSFPGGTEAMNAFINGNLKYPPFCLEYGIRGRVNVGFVVDKNGAISNVKVSLGVDPSLDKEAMRIVNSMPKWNPGKQNGQNVRVTYELPIDFKIPADYHPISPEKLRAMSTVTKTTNQTLQLSIVPNPTSADARIKLDGSGSTDKLEISVYDSSGKLIKNASKNGQTFSLSINNLPPGIYHVVGKDVKNKLTVTSQLVVNH